MKFHKILISILMIAVLAFVAFGASPPNAQNADDIQIQSAETVKATVADFPAVNEILEFETVSDVGTTNPVTEKVSSNTISPAAARLSTDFNVQKSRSRQSGNSYKPLNFNPFEFRQTEIIQLE